jgi:hypothetical protein
MGNTGSGATVKTENITAKSGSRFLLEKLSIYKLSIVHVTLIQNVCEAIEENAKRDAK